MELLTHKAYRMGIRQKKRAMTQGKVSGIKRHIIVDTMGLPHAVAVTTADVTDWDGAIQMLFLNLDNLSLVEKFLVDGGLFQRTICQSG